MSAAGADAAAAPAATGAGSSGEVASSGGAVAAAVAAASAAAASADASSTPVKEERKIGRLNLAAFNTPPASEEKGGAGGVGSEPRQQRVVGKLAGKLTMNIPVFAPGGGAPGGRPSFSGTLPTPISAASAAAAEGGASSPTAAADSTDSTAAAASPRPPPGRVSNRISFGQNSSAAASPSSGGSRTLPSGSSSSGGTPGKLHAGALMSNLNAMLGSGGPPGSANGTLRRTASEEAGSNGSASATAASSGNDESTATAAPIVHATRARVVRRARTKVATLQKAKITTHFQEVQIFESKVAAITVVSTGKPSPSATPAAAEQPVEPLPESNGSDATLASPSAPSTTAAATTTAENETAAATVAATPAPELDLDALIAAATPPPVVEEPTQPLQLDADARAAWSAAAMYGEFEEAEFDESRADAYRLLVTAGAVFLKHGKSGKPHERLVFINDLMVHVNEPGKRSTKTDPKNMVNLALAAIPKTNVVKGKTTANFKRSTAAKVDDALCLSIVARERELDLQARTPEERDAWFAAIKYLLQVAQDRREQALLGSAMGSY